MAKCHFSELSSTDGIKEKRKEKKTGLNFLLGSFWFYKGGNSFRRVHQLLPPAGFLRRREFSRTRSRHGQLVSAAGRVPGQLPRLAGSRDRDLHQRLGEHVQIRPEHLQKDGPAGGEGTVGGVRHLHGPLPLRLPDTDPGAAR